MTPNNHSRCEALIKALEGERDYYVRLWLEADRSLKELKQDLEADDTPPGTPFFSELIDDDKRGILQVTCHDERWYLRPSTDSITGLPTWQSVPSVTWIASFYPAGIGFYKWLASKGWDEAQAIKEAAGDKGSKVHNAIADLLNDKSIDMDAPYLNPSTERLEPLTLEEYEAIKSFTEWHTTIKPKLIAQDITVWNDVDGYAGTVDAVFNINNILYIVDFKTSKYIWPSHRIQVSAYKHALPDMNNAKLAILQLGYRKMGYKFTEIEDCYDLFLAAKRIWFEETKGQQPSQKEYPLSLSLRQASEVKAAQESKPDAEPKQEGEDGTIRRLGEKEQQDANPGRRGKREGGLPGVQNHGEPVRRGEGNSPLQAGNRRRRAKAG
jgi:hypothetical protein